MKSSIIYKIASSLVWGGGNELLVKHFIKLNKSLKTIYLII